MIPLFILLVLLLARLSTAQYAGTLDVNDPSCPRRHGPHLHYEWTYSQPEGRSHCYEINLPHHYYISMNASRQGPVRGAPDVMAICQESNCVDCTYFKVPADETADNLHMPCTETSGTRYIYIGR